MRTLVHTLAHRSHWVWKLNLSFVRLAQCSLSLRRFRAADRAQEPQYMKYLPLPVTFRLPAQKERASVTFSPTFTSSAVYLLETTMRRRQDTWDRLQAEMSSKRVKAADAMSGARKKKGSVPNESSSRDEHQNRTRNKHTGLYSQGNLSTSNSRIWF